MRVSVDMNKCTALGNCEAMAPDFFEVGDDGELQLLRSDVSDDDLNEVNQAIASCPTAALKLVND